MEVVHVKIKRKRYIQLNPLFVLDNITTKWIKKQQNRIHGEYELFQVKELKGYDKWIVKIISTFTKWNRETCMKCGCQETYEEDFDYFNHMVCEYTVKCKDCHATINAYAYGSFQEPNTRLGQWGMELEYLRMSLMDKCRKLKTKASK